MMKMNRAMLFVLLAVVSVMPAALAQVPPPQDPLRTVQDLVAQIDEAMSNIESELSRIEETQQIEDDGETLELNMDKGASAAQQAFQFLGFTALEETEQIIELNRTQQGPTAQQEPSTTFPDAVVAYEQSMQEFRARAEEIQSRIADIQLAILEGRILLSDELLNNLSARERADFLKSLSPEAQEIYKKRDPTRFSGFNIKLAQIALSIQSAVRIGLNMCVPKAEAALVGGCAGTCALGPTPPCLACAGATIGTGAAIVDVIWNRDACKRTCGSPSWRRPWRYLCHAGCYTAFLAALA